MSPFRPAILLPLCASLGLHAVMGWSIARHWQGGPVSSSEPIQIVYSEPRTASVKAAIPVKKPVSAPKKKLQGIPVPRSEKTAEMAPSPEPSDFEKKLNEKIRQQQNLLAKMDSPAPVKETAPAVRRPRSSAEVLADPQKGKIFVGYFTDVKRKIQDTFSSRFAHRYSSRGGVELGFVVNSQGFLEKIAVLPKGTNGNERLQELAIQCLRESAPFGQFPPELRSDPSITFSIVLYFEDH